MCATGNIERADTKSPINYSKENVVKEGCAGTYLKNFGIYLDSIIEVYISQWRVCWVVCEYEQIYFFSQSKNGALTLLSSIQLAAITQITEEELSNNKNCIK